MATKKERPRSIGKACVVGLLALAVFRISSFDDDRRRAWQQCARWLAGTVETRSAPPVERWSGVLDPVEEGSETGKASARLRLPVTAAGEPWPGTVAVDGPLPFAPGAAAVLAVPRCEAPVRNASDGDFFAAFRLPVLRLAAVAVLPRPAQGLRERVVQHVARTRQRLGERLRPWPRTFGAARAAWTGEIGVLPDPWRVALRDGGALAVVALSGQHVALVAGWCLALLGVVARLLPPRGVGYATVRVWLPTAVAAGFVALGAGAPSTIRAAATVVATALLRQRGLYVSPTRIAIVTAAATVIVAPGFLAAPGYLLSVAGALLLARTLREAPSKSRVLAVAVGLPLGLAPLVVYCFARLPLAALVAGTIVGCLWEGIVLPCAFVGLPLLDGVSDRVLALGAGATERMLLGVEKALRAASPWLAASVVVLPVPTDVELVALYGALAIFLGRRRSEKAETDE